MKDTNKTDGDKHLISIHVKCNRYSVSQRSNNQMSFLSSFLYVSLSPFYSSLSPFLPSFLLSLPFPFFPFLSPFLPLPPIVFFIFFFFLDATTHFYKRSCPYVRPSVGPSAPCYFRKTEIVDFEDRNSLNDIINNATMSDDEVVTSYGPPRSLFRCVLASL